jgi:16S rRNA pseudouridine516 synthase
MRLDRLLSNSGYGTRSQVKDLIRAGRVSLQGVPVKDPSLSIRDDQTALLVVDGMAAVTSRFLYIMLNKPACCLTALEDSRLHTVAELLPKELIFKGLAPVGRLDYNTTGLLLLTNNGTLSHRLTSPKWHVEKTYLVTYSGEPLTDEEIRLFASGMTLHEENHESVTLAPALLELRTDSTCALTLTEGKTHQVKRMIAAVSRSVTALHRESIGGITLDNGPDEGAFRNLTPEEIDSLFAAVKMEGTEK